MEPKNFLTVEQLKSRGAAVGLFSNFTEEDVLNLERQDRAKRVGIDVTSKEEEVVKAEESNRDSIKIKKAKKGVVAPVVPKASADDTSNNPV